MKIEDAEVVNDVVDNTPQVVKCKAVTLPLAEAIIAYLKVRSYEEVAQLVNSLSSSPEIEVTVTPNAK